MFRTVGTMETHWTHQETQYMITCDVESTEGSDHIDFERERQMVCSRESFIDDGEYDGEVPFDMLGETFRGQGAACDNKVFLVEHLTVLTELPLDLEPKSSLPTALPYMGVVRRLPNLSIHVAPCVTKVDVVETDT